MFQTVLSEQRGRIALLTLNRPAKLNAINFEMIDRLMQLLGEIENDPGIGAVILTGAGDEAFSAGADIPQFTATLEESVDAAAKAFVGRGQAMTTRLETFPKPIIAAVNGLAYGGGCEITEAVHLAVASDRAMFAKPEIAIGIAPTFGGTQRLPRLAGRKRALELLLTGDPFTVERAFDLGLVNKVVPHSALIDTATALAERVMRHSPVVASRIIDAVVRGLNVPIEEGLRIEADQFARIASGHDTREGLEAWIARRPPVYGGG